MRTKGAKDMHKRIRRTRLQLGLPLREHLINASFKIKKDIWIKFYKLYKRESSRIIREYIEGLVNIKETS